MAYLDLEDLRAYLDIDGTGDDGLIQEAIDDAVDHIEQQTHRTFEAATTTKYYLDDALDDDDGQMLHLNDDLLTITTLSNGDSSGTAIVAATYNLLPRNDGPPYHQILLTTNSGVYWEFDTDYWVSVAGTWGYSAAAPGDIKRATTVLAAYYFRQKDSQVFDVTAIPEAGVITIPQGIPATVTRIIKKYTRHL